MKTQQPERSKAKPALELAAASGSAIDAYQRHYRNVLKRQQWEKLEGREPQRQQEQAKAQKIERDNSPGMSC